MSRPPTRQLTMQFVLRTLKRVNMMARLDPDLLAEQLMAKHADVGGPAYVLLDVHEAMREKGYNSHPNGNCAQCGKEIMRDHNGAIYCSHECRQRAYGVRKAAAEGRNSPIAKRKRTKPTARQAAREIVAQHKEALAFANSMYALHLKAHPDEEKCSVEPQSDTSSSAGSE